MLKDLISKYSVIHIAGQDFRTKFSLNCLLCLEVEYVPIADLLKKDLDDWSIQDITQLAHAAMCDLPENREAVNDRNFRAVQPDLYTLGNLITMKDIPRLKKELLEAVYQAFSASSGQSDNSKDPHLRYTDEGHLKALYCNIMGNPEELFWSKNRKEIERDIDRYLEVKGQKERPIVVKQFDD